MVIIRPILRLTLYVYTIWEWHCSVVKHVLFSCCFQNLSICFPYFKDETIYWTLIELISRSLISKIITHFLVELNDVYLVLTCYCHYKPLLRNYLRFEKYLFTEYFTSVSQIFCLIAFLNSAFYGRYNFPPRSNHVKYLGDIWYWLFRKYRFGKNSQIIETLRLFYFPFNIPNGCVERIILSWYFQSRPGGYLISIFPTEQKVNLWRFRLECDAT